MGLLVGGEFTQLELPVSTLGSGAFLPTDLLRQLWFISGRNLPICGGPQARESPQQFFSVVPTGTHHHTAVLTTGKGKASFSSIPKTLSVLQLSAMDTAKRSFKKPLRKDQQEPMGIQVNTQGAPFGCYRKGDKRSCRD